MACRVIISREIQEIIITKGEEKLFQTVGMNAIMVCVVPYNTSRITFVLRC